MEVRFTMREFCAQNRSLHTDLFAIDLQSEYGSRMDFAVPQDYADLLSSFRSFLDREVRPVEERHAQALQEDVFTEEMREEGLKLRRRSAELGFYSAYMPEEAGGMGLPALGYTLLVEE